MIWDWLSLLPREIKHFWKFGGKTNTVRLTFFANRYGTLIFQTLNVAFILAPNSTSEVSSFPLECTKIDDSRVGSR